MHCFKKQASLSLELVVVVFNMCLFRRRTLVLVVVLAVAGVSHAVKRQNVVASSANRLRRLAATTTWETGTTTLATATASTSKGSAYYAGKGSTVARERVSSVFCPCRYPPISIIVIAMPTTTRLISSPSRQILMSLLFCVVVQFECIGITDVRYLSKQELYELGANRLALEEGKELPPLDTTSNPTLSLAEAHALSPPRCHLAPIEEETDLMRLAALGISGPAWTGVYKDLQAAYNDGADELRFRREGWVNLDGTYLMDSTSAFWNTNQPSKNISTNTQAVRNAATLVNGKLKSQSPADSLDGAFYQCCSMYAFEDTGEGDMNDFEDVLLSLITIQSL